MNSVLVHLLILWGVVALAVAVLLLAPRLGLELREVRHGGVFGFVGAAFGIVLGMTTFFVTQHYADLRTAAQREATSLGDVVAMTSTFPTRDRIAVSAQAYCYATDVIDREWPNMAHDENGATIVDGRQRAIYLELLKVGRRHVPRPTNWYWNAITSSLEGGDARQQRLLFSQPDVPSVLWILVYVGSGLVVLFAYFFHRESPKQMAGMLAAVVVMLTAIVGTLGALDAPTEEPVALKPEAMHAEQELLAQVVHVNPENAARFCRALPTPPAAASTIG
jgi:Protein of unknown function (DUF4239)